MHLIFLSEQICLIVNPYLLHLLLVITSLLMELFSDPTHFQCLARALQYLTITWLDLSYSVNSNCQFMHAPTVEHFKSLKRILRYVKGTFHYGTFWCIFSYTYSLLKMLIRLVILTLENLLQAMLYFLVTTDILVLKETNNCLDRAPKLNITLSHLLWLMLLGLFNCYVIFTFFWLHLISYVTTKALFLWLIIWSLARYPKILP